tara:strand:- start:82 stop:831 length:750 start_codon:yes stop_codon:yes gene_type:complete
MNSEPIPIKEFNGVKYIPFMSKDALTPFTAFWMYSIGEKIASRIDCNRFGKFLLSKKEEVLSIKDKLQDGGTGLGPNSTTARWSSYNVLNWRGESEDVKILEEEIIKTHDLYYTKLLGEKPPQVTILTCWMNIMKKGERILKHNHSSENDGYLSGNFTVACDDSKTIYIQPYMHYSEKELLERVEDWGFDHTEDYYASTNIPGNISLFPSYIPHFTTKHKSDTDRITLAFELAPTEIVFNQYANNLMNG